jgi:hypothetical protein
MNCLTLLILGVVVALLLVTFAGPYGLAIIVVVTAIIVVVFPGLNPYK